ncbi:MAG: hypothetical protein M3083_18850 [Actinomycetota bacterium]|nr:hypothetical protein [Actinomycetota bacterium]
MITARRAVISIILAGCAALMVWGFTLVRPTHTPPIFRNSAVKTVSPEPGNLVLRQDRVSVTLAQGYTLASDSADGLSIETNGAIIGIPQDEVQVLPGQNQYSFAPGVGRQFSELPVGRVCAIIQIKKAANPGDPGDPFKWCFQTH